MRASRRRQLRPQGALTYHAWVAEQDTKVLSSDGTCAFFLDRPLKAGRLDADWNYKLQLGNKSGGSGGITIITISRQDASVDGLPCRVINLYGPDQQMVTSLRWLGDLKKRLHGKASGTKKYTFDWEGRELVWDSRTTMAGTDHFCTDTGSGEVLCYFRATFLPLAKDGKIELSAKVRDETTRTVMLASCLAYREWADRRETGVYIK